MGVLNASWGRVIGGRVQNPRPFGAARNHKVTSKAGKVQRVVFHESKGGLLNWGEGWLVVLSLEDSFFDTLKGRTKKETKKQQTWYGDSESHSRSALYKEEKQVSEKEHSSRGRRSGYKELNKEVYRQEAKTKYIN